MTRHPQRPAGSVTLQAVLVAHEAHAATLRGDWATAAKARQRVAASSRIRRTAQRVGRSEARRGKLRRGSPSRRRRGRRGSSRRHARRVLRDRHRGVAGLRVEDACFRIETAAGPVVEGGLLHDAVSGAVLELMRDVAGGEVAGRLIGEERHGGVEHRDVDELPSTRAFARQQRGAPSDWSVPDMYPRHLTSTLFPVAALL